MKIITIFFLFITINVFSEDSFIIKKDGSKATIKSNSFRVDSNDKVIYFRLTSSEKEIKMSYNEFDYVEFGVNKFKTFRLNNSSEISGYFVLSETENRTLISSVITNEDEETSIVSYVFHVLDDQNNSIETHYFNNAKNKKNFCNYSASIKN
jgi:hypothetical protein